MISGLEKYNKIVLFSPVGGTDPVHRGNFRDGALLNICRLCLPDKVYLFMSETIWAYQIKDQRYTWFMQKLKEIINNNSALSNWNIDLNVDDTTFSSKDLYISDDAKRITDVHDFEKFYKIFKNELSTIVKNENLGSNDVLILNITSGTPQMESALCVLASMDVFSDVNIKLAQVITPAKSRNVHPNIDDEDNEAFYQEWIEAEKSASDTDRVNEVKVPSVEIIKMEQILKNLLRNYHYNSAYDMIDEIEKVRPGATHRYINCVIEAKLRSNLDASIFGSNPKRYNSLLPVRYKSIDSGKVKLIESALILQNNISKHNYIGFIRGISPLFFELLKLIINKYTVFSIDDYINRNNSWKASKLNRDSLNMNEISTLMKNMSRRCGEYWTSGYVKTEHLVEIIKLVRPRNNLNLLKPGVHGVSCTTNILDLRKVEMSLRNIAAHEIVSLSRQDLEKSIDSTVDPRYRNLDGIFSLIKNIFDAAGILDINDLLWNDYDRMNDELLSKI